MYAQTLVALAAFAGSASAAPVSELPQEVTSPAGWASGYLEDYQTFHSRFTALGCNNNQQGPNWQSDFYKECCKPLLAGQVLSEVRPAHCIPSEDKAASASSVVATQTAVEPVPNAEFTYSAGAVAAQVSKIAGDNDYASVTLSGSAVVPVLTPGAEPTAAQAAPEEPKQESKPSSTSEAPKETQAAKEEPKQQWKEEPKKEEPKKEEPKKEEPKQENNNNSGWVNGGMATWYNQEGTAGACGDYVSDDTPVIALPAKWYGGNGGQRSDNCDRTIEVKRVSDGRTVNAVVKDMCPSCEGDNYLDLSRGAFRAIADDVEGMVDITWRFL